jgi:hypothetical protein
LSSDFSINCPTQYIASSISSTGQKVWKEVFNAGSGLHGGIQPFFSDDPGAAVVNVTLANIEKDRVVSFAIHNDPNAQSWSGLNTVFWPTYNMGSTVLESNDSSIRVVNGDYDASERCAFFRENGEVVQN